MLLRGWFQRSKLPPDRPGPFRVEPLEPRLLLSGTPLDPLREDHLVPSLLPVPAAEVETMQTNPPSIDWGDQAPLPVDSAVVDTAPAATITAETKQICDTDEPTQPSALLQQDVVALMTDDPDA